MRMAQKADIDPVGHLRLLMWQGDPRLDQRKLVLTVVDVHLLPNNDRVSSVLVRVARAILLRLLINLVYLR